MSAAIPAEPSPSLPKPMAELAAHLESLGHATYWVGEGLTEALLGRSPAGYCLVTEAEPVELIDALPTAVPTRPGGRAFMVPSEAGPVDLAPLARGTRIEDHLALRGFRLLAMAWRPRSQEWIDPESGLEDLRNSRLCSVAEPEADLRRSPRRVLQAARLAAALQLQVDPPVEAAMADVFPTRCRNVPACELRHELNRLLLTENPAPGVDLLRRTGADVVLGLAGREDSARLIASAPPDLGLRWFIWLRDSRGSRTLRRLRINLELAGRIQRLLAAHPVEQRLPRRRHHTLRRGFERIGHADCEKLIELRRQELESVEGDVAENSRSELEALALAFAAEVEEAAREESKITPVLAGRQVMALLGLGPSPRVGAALAFLDERVNADPSCNTEASLDALLRDWAAENPED
ncbi:MAG: hypothetical protein VCC04_04600 [Myxococcota bacterium]